MYLYLRRWVVWKLSALIAAIAYMGSTCLVARIQFPPMVVSACYCPLILACVDACIEQLSIRKWLALVIAIALLALSAHPQVAYLTLLTSALYAACRMWNGRTWAYGLSSHGASVQPPNLLRRLWYFFSAICLGFAVAAAQLIPMLDLMRVGTRERMTPTLANRFVFDLSHLATLVFPNAFGNPAHANYFGGGNAWEPGIFIGWLPLGALVYSIAACHMLERLRFWLAAGALSLWLSTGVAGGLFWVAFYVIPGLSNFHDPARFLFIATVSMCSLGAIGMDAWQHKQGVVRGITAGAAIAVTAAPLIWYGIQWNPTTTQSLDQHPSHKHAATNGRSYLPAHDLYWRRFVTEGYSDFGPESNVNLILNSDTPNVQMREGIETAAGYEPVPVSGPAEVDGLTRIALRRDEPTLLSLLYIMDVTEVMLPDYRALYDAGFVGMGSPKGLHSDVNIEKLNEMMHRAWLVPAVIHVEGKIRAEAAIAGPDFDPATSAIVSGLDSSHKLSVSERPKTQSPRMNDVHIDSTSTTSVRLTVDAGESAAFMVYSGTCYPGWKAEIDGRATRLYCTDVAFLGLNVPPGTHHVHLFYAPSSVRLGVFVLALSLMCGAAIFAFSLISRRAMRFEVCADSRRSHTERDAHDAFMSVPAR